MRLSENAIKQGILHSEQSVRHSALLYFSGSHSPDPTVMPLAIQAIENYGWEKAFRLYRQMEDLAQTDETVSWILGELDRLDGAESEAEIDCRFHLTCVLMNADIELLSRHESAIYELENLEPSLRESIAERIRLRSADPDSCWQRLLEFCDREQDVEYVSQADLPSVYQLLEVIGRHPQQFADRVTDILSESGDDQIDDPAALMEDFMVYLAGEMQLEVAASDIVRRLHLDDEWLCGDPFRALGRIGGDTTVASLAVDFADADSAFQISASILLGNIHSELAVIEILRLLMKELEPEIRLQLAHAAVGQFETRAVEPVRQIILNTELDPELVELRQGLLAACVLMGVEFPEFNEWQEAAKHDAEFCEQWAAKYPMLGSSMIPEQFGEEEESGDDEWTAPSETVIRDERVGRNDPCPCGSGKKFKKCCLRAGNSQSKS